MSKKKKISIPHFERLVVNEAKNLNKWMIKRVLQAEELTDDGIMQEIDLQITESTLNVMILGAVAGGESLPKDLSLSIEYQTELERLTHTRISSDDYAVLRAFFENEANNLATPVKDGFAKTLTRMAKELDSDVSGVAIRATVIKNVLRYKGYAPATARNISTLFRTGFYMAYNGVRYDNTRNNGSVWGYKYHTAEDEKVRASHVPQNGVTLPKNDAYWSIWIPPNGYNCRCTLEILYDEENLVQPKPGFEPDEGFRGSLFQSIRGF